MDSRAALSHPWRGSHSGFPRPRLGSVTLGSPLGLGRYHRRARGVGRPWLPLLIPASAGLCTHVEALEMGAKHWS